MLALFADELVAAPEVATPNGLGGFSTGGIAMLIILAMVLGTLLLIVPQLLRSQQRTMEMHHQEHMKALEMGQALGRADDRSRAAGRTAALVPMVTVCAAATVTCFLSAYDPNDLFRVSIAVWSVAGIVSLAAITGGVALMGRLAQLNAGLFEDEHDDDVPEDAIQR